MTQVFLKPVEMCADVDGDMGRLHALDPATSLADYASSTRAFPQAAERTLGVVTERSFTGEISFDVGAGVVVYADGGHAYYAERADDPPLGTRLVAAGALTDEQLRRGTLGDGDVEHLGRLFERDATIDRDAVIEATERMTDEVIREVVPHQTSVRFTAYRHHRSGIHRWFVGPRGNIPERRLAGLGDALAADSFDVRPLESSDAPESASPTPSTEPVDRPEIRIEWSDPSPLDVIVRSDEPSNPTLELEAPNPMLLPPEDDEAPAPLPAPTVPESMALPESMADAESMAEAESVALPPPPQPVELEPLLTEARLAEPVVLPTPPQPVELESLLDEAALAEPIASHLEDPPPEAEDVEAAVRRALAAIEQAVLASTVDLRLRVSDVEVAEFSVPQLLVPSVISLGPSSSPADTDEPMSATESVPPTESGPGWAAPAVPPAFPPPSVPQRTLPAPTPSPAGAPVAVLDAPGPAEDHAETTAEHEMPSIPEPGQASIVFLDEPEETVERRGALRRLIDSLRGH